MAKLKSIDLRGFKSVRHLRNFELRSLNVLIGPNAAGKSNFISFFRMLSWMMPTPGNLQEFVARSGGGNALLFDGASTTPQLEAQLTLETERGENDYSIRLFHGAPDRLVFADEKYRFSDRTFPTPAPWRSLGSGHEEAKLITVAAAEEAITARTIIGLLKKCVVYQFHNTSESARIRQKWSVSDNLFLKEDGANLAPFLHRLRDSSREVYYRITETLRQIVPFFADFVLEPEYDHVILRWREQGTDHVFAAHQASDGTLRIMALISLLLQPEHDLPDLLILDEPELGLHPAAMTIVAGLIRSVSQHTQIILATQSLALVDQFAPEDIVVVERPSRETVFRRLESERLKDWLEEYSLAELWEKNVLGGRP